MKFQREIERKFVVNTAFSLSYVDRMLEFSNCEDVLVGTSTDTFWLADGVDFVRLRKNSKELTIKITDRGTVTNRVEENLVLEDYNAGFRFATAVWGIPIGVLEKTYFVYFLPDVVISLYQVTGDERIFLEVEGKSLKVVDKKVKQIKETLKLTPEKRSLFQMFLLDRKAA